MSWSGSRGRAWAADEEAMVAKTEKREDDEDDGRFVARRKLGLRLGERRLLGFVAGGEEGWTAWEGKRIMLPFCQEAQESAASTVRGSDSQTLGQAAPGPMAHKQHAVRRRWTRLGRRGPWRGRGVLDGEDSERGKRRGTSSAGQRHFRRLNPSFYPAYPSRYQ